MSSGLSQRRPNGFRNTCFGPEPSAAACHFACYPWDGKRERKKKRTTTKKYIERCCAMFKGRVCLLVKLDSASDTAQTRFSWLGDTSLGRDCTSRSCGSVEEVLRFANLDERWRVRSSRSSDMPVRCLPAGWVTVLHELCTPKACVSWGYCAPFRLDVFGRYRGRYSLYL